MPLTTCIGVSIYMNYSILTGSPMRRAIDRKVVATHEETSQKGNCQFCHTRPNRQCMVQPAESHGIGGEKHGYSDNRRSGNRR